MKWLLLCACALSHESLAADGASAPRKLLVAVLPIKAQGGVKDSVAAVVSEQLAAAIQARNHSVMSPDDLQARLGFERQKQLMGCTEQSCLVEVGQALGVDKLVSGSIATVGSSVVISLALINNQSGAVDYRYSERVKNASDEAFLDLIPAAVNALFPSPPGTLAGTAATPPHAEGEAQTTGPGAAPGGNVAAWTTLGVGAAALVAGGIFFGLARSAQGEVAKGNPAPYATLQEKVAAGKSNDVIGGVALGVGGALAVTSAVLFMVRPSSAAPAVSAAPVAGGGVVVVGGSF
jgi:TolB-like protein